MKKIIAVLLAIVMVFSIGSVAAFAAETYEIVFAEFPYDISSFRSDYIGKYVGYEYGTDYWFTITNEDGTTTDIKGFPYSVSVKSGKALEFTVSVADYVEPASVRILAYPTGLNAENLYEPVTGEPDARYYVASSSANTYGLVPSEDLTVCLSEWHLFNDCFLYDFPVSDFYTSERLQYNANAVNPWDMYTPFEWGNTKVIYENETIFFEVRMPIDGAYDYHYETYQVYYTTGFGPEQETTYLKKNASEKEGTEAIDLRVAHYETDDAWVDIYAIPNADPTMELKVVNTVTYTLGMLAQFFEDFSLENLEDIDLGSIDLSPMLEYILRLANLVVKLLNAFGLNISLPDLLG